MSDFFCSICGGVKFLPTHKCAPAWECATDADFDDAKVIYAIDAELAAEKFCEWHDVHFADYPSSHHVFVRGKDGTVLEFTVEMETVPTYSAHP